MNRHDAAGASPQYAPSDEYRLLDHLQRLGRGRGDYHAVHVHLARLRAQHRQDHHLRVAEATFASQQIVGWHCSGATEATLRLPLRTCKSLDGIALRLLRLP